MTPAPCLFVGARPLPGLPLSPGLARKWDALLGADDPPGARERKPGSDPRFVLRPPTAIDGPALSTHPLPARIAQPASAAFQARRS